jgi:hypothetical protein
MAERFSEGCPLMGGVYCLYEQCPYWDAGLNECGADCIQEALERRQEGGENVSAAAGFPCTIHWTEDND